jgi:DEAD/DEAH box helicase domain-containing protein
MQDPLGAFYSIRDNFLRYVRTAFCIKNEKVDNERRQILLDASTDSPALYRMPWIEPVPRYESTGTNFGDLTWDQIAASAQERHLRLPAEFTPAAFARFQDLVTRGLFPANQPLYVHQFEMMVRAICGESLVITAGTGSGKTESFLLPIFARLVVETTAPEWQSPVTDGGQPTELARRDDWWVEAPASDAWRQACKRGNAYVRSQRVAQRFGEPAGRAAVRALILYPMNALVEDQMSRLRKALDSGANGQFGARQWHTNNLGEGQRLYFGRYNGETPVSGHEDNPDNSVNSDGVNKLRKELKEAQEAFVTAQAYDSNNKGHEDARFFFPAIDGAEMRSRWDMQDSPPDILVTNFSMLSVMLMRDADKGIFEQTRLWLENDPWRTKKEGDPCRIFHLVIDELHLYRGTAGTEVAYLVRLLLHRLGLDPDSPQLRVLASSASLKEGREDSERFIKEFFGRDGIGIIAGAVQRAEEPRDALDPAPFREFARRWSRESNAGINGANLHEALRAEYTAVANVLGGLHMQGSGREKLVQVLSHPELAPKIANRLLYALQDGDRFRAFDIEDFGRRIFAMAKNLPSKDDVLDAVRGLLIARGAIENQAGCRDSLPSFRLHWFFRNLEGLWASPDPRDVEVLHEGGGRNVGRLYPNNRRLLTPAGNRVLELLYCEQCGELFLGGIKLRNPRGSNDLSLLSGDPDLERVPENDRPLLAKDRKYSDYGIFWPSGENEPSPLCPTTENPSHATVVRNFWGPDAVAYNAPNAGVDPSLQNYSVAGWSPCFLEPATGRILQPNQVAEDERNRLVHGFIYLVGRVHRNAVNTIPEAAQSQYPAFPAVCPCCSEDYRYKVNGAWHLNKKQSPIRTFRTGFTKISQIFAKELFHALPAGKDSQDGRKLVVFSDSREDAAKIANDVERYHFDEMMREAIFAELRVPIMGKKEFADCVEEGREVTGLAAKFEERFSADAERIRSAFRERTEGLSKIQGGDSTQEVFDRFASANLIIQGVKSSDSQSIPLRRLYWPEDGSVPILIKRLKNLGLNPAGSKARYQNLGGVDWSDVFDFENPDKVYGRVIQRGGEVGGEAIFANQGGLGMIRQNVLSQLFGKLYFGFESSGLGLVSIKQDNLSVQANACGLPEDTLLQVCNSVVRLLGEKWHFLQQEPNYNEPQRVYEAFDDPLGPFRRNGRFSSVVEYCHAVADLHGIDRRDLEHSVHSMINQHGIEGWLLNADALHIRLAGDDDPVWRCSHCQRLHLHPSGGLCCHCCRPLTNEHNGRSCEVRGNHYYADTTAQEREPFRLHSEELTGQTDDQAQRQRQFRDIVLDKEGPKLVKTIDLLSVTTTMEVGIDIGGLRAVMQANMPPERFNYQQRAGRGGRRGQAYSIVMTLCRQRSHDTIHFEDPWYITGADAPTPFLAMDQLDIARRVMAKGILRDAFLEVGVRWYDGPQSPPDSHGEFGFAENDPTTNELGWSDRRAAIAAQLEKPKFVELRQSLSIALTAGFQGTAVTPHSLETFVKDNLVEEIDRIVSNEELKAFVGLAHRLAEGALLPMFGMPSKVRVLYHGRIPDGAREVPTIDRELDLAITEFAPGSEKTKDKRIHKSYGICPSLFLRGGHLRAMTIDPFVERKWMARCSRCHFVKTYALIASVPPAKQRENDACPHCYAGLENGYAEFEVRVPNAFFTQGLREGEDAAEGGEIVSAPAARLAEGNANDAIQLDGLNAAAVFHPNARLYTLNDNKDRLFRGRNENNNEVRTNRPNDGSVTRWVSDPQNGDEEIALIAPKTTDSLIFRLARVPLGLDAAPIRPLAAAKGQSSESYVRPGVNSALMSAAFLIRSTAADELDIDPEEFDICHLRLAEIGPDLTGRSRFTGEFIFADHLANGSGFTRWLAANLVAVIREIVVTADRRGETEKEFLRKVLSTGHRRECDTSCYACLQNFRNMRYHSILDWQLGISMVRTLADVNYQAGLDNVWTAIELEGWRGAVERAVGTFIGNFGTNANIAPLQDGVSGFLFGGMRVVVRHPLWDTLDPRGIFAEWVDISTADVGQENVRSVDSFDLLRRPSWVFQTLDACDGVFKL